MTHKKARISAGIVAAGIAVTGIVGAGPSSAQDYDLPKAKTISMILKGKNPKFKGPRTIERGARLTIVNKTKPKAIGPHTFTLIKKSLLPKGRAEFKACSEEFAGVCGTVVKAHKVNPQTFAVGRVLVKAGKRGWDKMFTASKKGDSWYTETRNEDFTQKVTAKAGTTLTYFCVVHANMQGSLRVTN